MDGQIRNERTGEPLDIRPGPASVPDTALREHMNEESPDGQPPSEPVRRESRALFLSLLVLVVVIVVASLVWRGGWVPGVAALIIGLGFVGLAAWPAWHAGLDRKIEERHMTDQIRAEQRAGRPT